MMSHDHIDRSLLEKLERLAREIEAHKAQATGQSVPRPRSPGDKPKAQRPPPGQRAA